MAASNNSDDSSNAPENFHLSSSIEEDSGSRLSVYQVKCPLCCNLKKIFHCRDCIRNGDFIHSTHHLSDRFAEKQLKYLRIKTAQHSQEINCCQYLQHKKRTENLRAAIKQKTERIILLRQLISDTRHNLSILEGKRKELQSDNAVAKVRLPTYRNKVLQLEDVVISRAADVTKRYNDFFVLQNELQTTIRDRIDKLIQYIFPISSPKREDLVFSNCQTLSEGAQARELDDATRTTYIGGRWIETALSDIQHVIVAPALPWNGDYSAYVDFMIHNKDNVSSASTSDVPPNANPAFRIGAALTYTAQLVNVLSHCLDIRLPNKMVYSDYCNSRMSEPQFIRKVARLNANILYLCYTQQIKLSNLQPYRTLENIQVLLDHNLSNLGRNDYMDPVNKLFDSHELQILQDLKTGEDSESDDENNLPHEWEAITVPHQSMPDDLDQQPIIQVHNNPQQVASIAGGLVTSAAASIASMFRGWTTGR